MYLASSRSFSDRQTYLRICDSFLTNAAPSATTTDDEDSGESSPFLLDEKRQFFSTHLAKVFFTLASDPVSNVRVVFAEIVLKHQGKQMDVGRCFPCDDLFDDSRCVILYCCTSLNVFADYLRDCEACPEALKVLLSSTEFYIPEELLAVLPAAPSATSTTSTTAEEVGAAALSETSAETPTTVGVEDVTLEVSSSEETSSEASISVEITAVDPVA